MNITTKEQTFTVDTEFGPLEVTLRDGRFSRGESGYSSLDAAVNGYLKEQREAKAKTDRAQRRLNTNIEGELTDGTVVKVRGLNARQRNSVLITKPDGQKTSIEPRYLLRRLTPEESAERNALRERSTRANNRRWTAEGAGKDSYDFEFEAEIEASFDPQTGQFSASIDGEVFTDESLYGLGNQIKYAQFIKQYPYTVSFDRGTGLWTNVVTDRQGDGRRFVTPEAAEEYIQALNENRETSTALSEWDHEHKFDLTQLT